MKMVVKCTKIAYSFFLVNIIYLIMGGLLLEMGISFMIKHNKIAIPLEFLILPISGIAIGAVFIPVAVLGFCGTVFQNNKLLVVYGFSLITLIVTESTLVIISYVVIDNQNHLNRTRKVVLLHMIEEFERYATNSTANDLLIKISCCGLIGPEYWDVTTPSSIANSTCAPISKLCTLDRFEYIVTTTNILNGIMLASVVIEMIELFSLGLLRVKRTQESVQ